MGHSAAASLGPITVKGAFVAAALKQTMAAMDPGKTSRYFGVSYWDGARWWAKIGDSLLDARWADPMQPIQNGNIVVDITDDGRGQASALVVCGYTDQPRPSTGTVTDVLAAGTSTRIVFTGADAVSYTTDRFIGSYNLGDPVYVSWDNATPTVIGKIGALAVAPEAPPPPPPPVALTGETHLVPTASDTFGVGGWGRWATSQRGGEDVYTGTWGGNTVTGSWFYGAPKPELAGKTVNRVLFKVPRRLNVGTSGDVVLHFYAHTNGARPGGDTNRVSGPFDVTVPGGYGGGYTDLSTSFGPILAAGGGISIAGGSYAGFESRLKNPTFGELIINWSS